MICLSMMMDCCSIPENDPIAFFYVSVEHARIHIIFVVSVPSYISTLPSADMKAADGSDQILGLESPSIVLVRVENQVRSSLPSECGLAYRHKADIEGF